MVKERRKATSRWPPGSRARWPPRTQRRRAEETGGKRRKRRKSRVYGVAGAVRRGRKGTASRELWECSGRARRGLRKGGGGFLPPRAGHRRFPTAGKAQPEPWHAGAVAASSPQMLRDGDPALNQLSLLPLSEAV